jgi:hypothetical protein
VISEVLGEALDVYKRLWRRSVLVAGLVFAVVSLGDAFAGRSSSFAVLLVTLVLSVIGGLLVQGALVEVVRDLHEGRQPASLGWYYDRARGSLGTLLGATLLAGIGVAVGFLLLVVPGLVLFARWSLIVPLVMLEGRTVGEAFSRSNELIKGRTGRVLVIGIVAGLIQAVAGFAIHSAFAFLSTFASILIGGTIASAITVPYGAHVLTVLYYKLTEPERPVLPTEPPSQHWRSIWDEEPPA